MTIFWLDAQLRPQLAAWLRSEFGHEAHALRELGLRDADARTSFDLACKANVILLSNDVDFVNMVSRFGAGQDLERDCPRRECAQHLPVHRHELRVEF